MQSAGSAQDPITVIDEDEDQITPPIFEIEGVCVYERDLALLENERWLNDTLVNGYLLLCIQQFALQEKVFLLESYAYYNMTQADRYRYLEKYTTRCRLNPLDVEWIFAPLNVRQSHWTLAIVKPQERIIMYADSLGGLGYEQMRHIYRFLCDEAREKRGENIEQGWQTRDLQTLVPRQPNSNDCGVYLCTVARVWMEYIMNGGADFPETFGFSAKDVPDIRKRMQVEMQSGYLI